MTHIPVGLPEAGRRAPPNNLGLLWDAEHIARRPRAVPAGAPALYQPPAVPVARQGACHGTAAAPQAGRSAAAYDVPAVLRGDGRRRGGGTGAAEPNAPWQ